MLSYRKVFYAVIVFMLSLVTWANVEKESKKVFEFPEITADEPIVFDDGRKALVARGNVHVRYGTMLLGADNLFLYQEDALGCLESNVFVNQGSIRAVAKKASYDFKKKTLEATDYKVGKPGRYIYGEQLSTQNDYVDARRATLYFNEPDYCGVNIWAYRAEGVPAEQMIVHHAVFRIGKVPVFYWPNMVISNNKQPLDINFSWGKNALGRYLRTTIFWKKNLNTHFGILADYYDPAGALVGPAYEYHRVEGERRVDSSLYSGYLHDRRRARGNDIRKRPIKEDRCFIEWRHRQSFDERMRINTVISAWKDSEITRQTRPSFFEKNQSPDSFVEGVYLGDNGILSVFTRLRPNNFQRIQERLPEISYEYFPSKIGDTDFYHTAKISYTNLLERSFVGSVGQVPTVGEHIHRLDSYYGVGRPITMTHWLRVMPVVGGRIIRYDAIGYSEQCTWMAGELGMDIEMSAYRYFEYENKTWNIDGLRHIIKPLVQYRIMPMKSTGNTQLATIDKEVANTHMDPLDLGQMRKINTEYRVHKLRLGVHNALQTKSSPYGSRDLVDFDIFQDIRLSKAPEEKTLSDLYVKGGIHPAPWIQFSIYQRYNPYTMASQETTTTATILDGTEWSVGLSSTYLKDKSEQYGIRFGCQLTSRERIDASWKLDAKKGKLVEERYGFSTILGNSWKVMAYVIFREGTQVYKHTQLGIECEWLSF